MREIAQQSAVADGVPPPLIRVVSGFAKTRQGGACRSPM